LNLQSLTSWLICSYQLWRDLCFGRLSTLYLICSRSRVGFLRDLPALLASLTGLRVVVHSHGSDIVDLLHNSRLARWLYSHCELIVPSEHLIVALSPLQFVKLHRCENFLDAVKSQFRPNEISASSSLSSKVRILWNSNLMASKGILDVLEAVESLSEYRDVVSVDVIGTALTDSEMSAEEIARHVQTYVGRNINMHFHGPVSPHLAIQMLEEADVVVLPSRYPSECQPLAILNAMCAAKGVIVTPSAALRATVSGYPAVFVEANSVEALSDALRRLILAYDRHGFNQHLQPAVVARERFSPLRFDQEIDSILSGEHS
jgi:glycosyltransferase involved in cell wall biosynthesis